MTPLQLAKLIYESESAQLTEVRRAHRLPWKDLPDAIKQMRIATARTILSNWPANDGVNYGKTSLQIRDKGNQK